MSRPPQHGGGVPGRVLELAAGEWSLYGAGSERMSAPVVRGVRGGGEAASSLPVGG